MAGIETGITLRSLTVQGQQAKPFTFDLMGWMARSHDAVLNHFLAGSQQILGRCLDIRCWQRRFEDRFKFVERPHPRPFSLRNCLESLMFS